MKLPRDLNGVELAKRLERVGFVQVHQTGSHIICRAGEYGHTEPVPAHRPLKVGTLASILRRVANAMGISRDELIRLLEL
jgi:predicted RNA binding protein YcfA (HicA-like mRNA interferase family)